MDLRKLESYDERYWMEFLDKKIREVIFNNKDIDWDELLDELYSEFPFGSVTIFDYIVRRKYMMYCETHFNDNISRWKKKVLNEW